MSATGIEISRRGFLRASGFALAGGALGCARAPVEKAIPYLVAPEEIVPGRAYWQASTCGGCGAGCGVLVKGRDGRPIKLEGLPGHPLSQGGLCAIGQASVLELYDAHRLARPLAAGRDASWPEVDAALAARLVEARARGGRVRFLTATVTSPTLDHWLDRFLAGFADGRRVVYDPLSSSAILDAHAVTHGSRLLPRYRFARARAVASFGADWLGSWISPVEFSKGFRAGRRLEAEPPRMAYLAQFEAVMTLTGAKADRRVRLLPQETGLALTHLCARLAAAAGVPFATSRPAPLPAAETALAEVAGRLWRERGRALVVSDSQEVAVQVLVNFANHLLGGYGTTLDLERPSRQRQGDDAALARFLDELDAGAVDAVLVHGVNPAYDLPGGEAIAAALARVPLLVCFAERVDETARQAQRPGGFVCPAPHPLETWGDAEPVAGLVAVAQPAVTPLGATRAPVESLAAWAGAPAPAYELVRAVWRERIYPRAAPGAGSFDAFWDRTVHDGFAEVAAGEPAGAAGAFDLAAVRPLPAAPAAAEWTLLLYPKVAMADGRHAHNPWLQELPDPVSKVTWDNYACLSRVAAARLGVADGDVVRVALPGGPSLTLPALVQAGQDDRAVAVALGYGRAGTDRFYDAGPRWLFGRRTVERGGTVGGNAAPLLALAGGALGYARPGVEIARTGERRPLACTQMHHSLDVPAALAPAGAARRPAVEETTLAALVTGAEVGAEPAAEQWSLWPQEHAAPGHRWGMAIDLTACTGCSACVVACQAENNVPVVGRDEVLRRREMHWLRIDRYYQEDDAAGGGVAVAFQPMLCQHCGHAPCETVCPVLATVHSSEGLNQQVYNRCVGTRYCANNCPYKVRRFNWFDYPHEEPRENLVLNPDVVVRSRGVMEKCSLCVQRIQEAKAEAKSGGPPLADGAVATACQQSCPADAIVFGDLADPASRVSRLAASPRHYHVLAELNLRPVVGYLRLVRQGGEAAPAAPPPEEARHG